MLNLTTVAQRLRLEMDIMAEHLPQFLFIPFLSETCFMGTHTTTVGGQDYTLKLVLPSRYPDDRPSLYVTRPLTLDSYGYQGTLNEMGISHAFHTLDNGPDGCVQICHGKSEQWDPSQTCVGVLMKGILWVEAYDAHMSTGRNIAQILYEWQRRLPHERT